MKKIIAAFVLAAVALAGASAKKSVKDRIYEEKIGKFKELDIDEGTFRIKKTFGSQLLATEYAVKLYSEDGTLGIAYKTDLASKESLRFDKDARDALRKAAEQYFQDYDGKKLSRGKKFNNAYGVARSKIVWKMLSDRAVAHPKIQFGYIFVGKSVYFAIKVPQTVAEEKKGDIVVQYVGNIYYFTRSQLKEVLAAMEESQIGNALASLTVDLPEDDDYEYSEDDGGQSVEEYDEASDVDEKQAKKEKKNKKAKKVKEEKADETADYAEAE